MHMNTEEEIFEAAAALPAAERPAYLDEACAGQPELRARIEALIRSDEVTGFMEQIAVAAGNPKLPAELARLHPEEAGQRIGNYNLLEQIGEGGFGIVWVAEQVEPVRRRVALKIIKPGMDSREVIGRFEQERQSLAMMEHPNIAKVFDAGATDKGRPYFVMELVRGVKITDYCDKENLPTADRLKLLITVCQAVQHAHQKGIIHRDLKPSNILVTPGDDGEPVPKVIDFGVAKAIQQKSLTDATVYTQFEQMIGTPAYMSPEQAGLGPMDIDTRSDVYSLGVLLYELLTGRPPFDPKELLRAGHDEMRRVIREVEPPKPSTRISSLPAEDLSGTAARRHTDPPKLISTIRGDLDWIAMKALEKSRARRYESATGLAADIQRHLTNQPVLARPPGKPYLLSRFIRRHKFGFAAGAAIACAMLGGIAAAVWGFVRADTARKIAEGEVTKTKLANEENKQNLHRASMTDYASAVRMLEEEGSPGQKGSYFSGARENWRWQESVAILARSLERDAENYEASLRLFDTLRQHLPEKRDWPLSVAEHKAPVQAAWCSPDGTKVVTSSGDKSAQTWNALTEEPIAKPMQHDTIVRNVRFSRDAGRIVTTSAIPSRNVVQIGPDARVWDTASGEPIGVPLLHEGGVKDAVLSADGTRVLTVGDAGYKSVRVWDVATGRALGKPILHSSEVGIAGFSPDGTKVLTSTSFVVQLWDAATGESLGGLLHEKKYVNLYDVRFSPDGTKILTVGGDGVQLWDAVSGKNLRVKKSASNSPNQAVFSPDGTRFMVRDADGTVSICEVQTGEPVGALLLHEREVTSMSFSHDGLLVVTASDVVAQVWDAATGRPVGPSLRHSSRVRSAEFNPDRSKIITVSTDNTVRVWDAVTNHNTSEPFRHKDQVIGARFNSDGTTVIAALLIPRSPLETTSGGKASYRHTVWHLDTGGRPAGETRRSRPSDRVIGPIFSPDGSRFATILPEGIVKIWHAESPRPVELARHEHAVMSVCFSPDGTRLATISEKTIRLWDAATATIVGNPIQPDGGIGRASFSPDGKRIATLNATKIQVWDTMDGSLLGEQDRPKHDSMDLTTSSDGSFLLTNNYRVTKLRDGVTGQARPQDFPGRAGCVSPNGKTVITANGQVAQLWDTASGIAIGPPIRHNTVVGKTDCSPDGSRAITVTGTWLTEQLSLWGEGAVFKPASFSPNGKWLLTVNHDATTVHFWDTTTGQRAGMPIQHQEPSPNAHFSGAGAVYGRPGYTLRIWATRTAADSARICSITPGIRTWAKHLAGLRFTDDGRIEEIPDAERLAGIANPTLPPGPWTDLSIWINTPAPNRRIDPKSGSTARQIAERERDFDGEGNVESLESALQYDPTVPLARLFLGAAMEKEQAERPPPVRDRSVPQRAAYLRRYDLDALSRALGSMPNEELAALWIRAGHHLLALPPETKIGIAPGTTTPRDEAKKAGQKALELAPESSDAKDLLSKIQVFEEWDKQ
jgi:WD40 repeat protein/serine/threonine protein kinase